MRDWVISALATALLLGGCGSSAPESSPDTAGVVDAGIPTPEVPADNLLAPPVIHNGGSAALERDMSSIEGTTRYTCANGLVVLAHHDLAWDVMRLTIGSATFELSNMLSDTGGKYRTETGRAPGKSLMWATKGDKALLIEGPKDAPHDSADQKSITCRRAV
jgi:membrane-bound inhibitor of C-type lysozyme